MGNKLHKIANFCTHHYRNRVFIFMGYHTINQYMYGSIIVLKTLHCLGKQVFSLPNLVPH